VSSPVSSPIQRVATLVCSELPIERRVALGPFRSLSTSPAHPFLIRAAPLPRTLSDVPRLPVPLTPSTSPLCRCRSAVLPCSSPRKPREGRESLLLVCLEAHRAASGSAMYKSRPVAPRPASRPTLARGAVERFMALRAQGSSSKRDGDGERGALVSGARARGEPRKKEGKRGEGGGRERARRRGMTERR
jgi:hypothetical protein